MSLLKPVPGPYEPAYPRELSEEEIEKLLRPGLFRRFSRETLIAGALLAGLSAGATACQEQANAAGKNPPPQAQQRLSPAELEAAQKKADGIAREILGQYKVGGWNAMTSIYPSKALGPNPMVKYPLIPISYGNSYVGLFDSEKAIQSTKRLFEAYGVKLQPKGAVKGEGFAFEADGWDAERKIGFRLIRPGEQPRDTQEAKPTAEPEKALEAGEMEPLGKAMTAGQLKMFVAETHGFPNMDGDLYTPMEYYLQSVIDYLNWALGGAEIDKEKIFGRVPKGRQR